VYYFAYGSNLNHKQMLERCPDSQPRFLATLHNYKLVFVGWSRQWRGGIASIKPFRGERILEGAGFKRIKFMEGSIAAWPYEIYGKANYSLSS